MYARRSKAKSHFHRGSSSGRSRNDTHGLSRAMNRLSFRDKPEIKVPLLSEFKTSRDSAVAGPSVKLGEPIEEPNPIRLNYSSSSAYLKAMQAHTQQEFAASIKEGASSANRLEGGGWMELTCRPDPARAGDSLSFFVDSREEGKEPHDFKKESWGRHAIQFEGKHTPYIVTMCAHGIGDHSAYLVVAGTNGSPPRYAGLSTRVRTLGYMGPFLREYGSAGQLLATLHDQGFQNLLPMIASPGPHDWTGERQSAAVGTFVPIDAASIDTSSVPLNSSQRKAVAELTGGLDIVQGPPGTGKSTIIYHVVNSRVAPGARTLITCVRNQAIDAVSQKVAPLDALVFGGENRVGDFAREYTMAGRMRNDPELVSWRRVHASWNEACKKATAVSWTALHLTAFPGLARLRTVQIDGYRASDDSEAGQMRKRGRAAQLWLLALEHVLQTVYMARLEKGDREQRRTFKQIKGLEMWKKVLFAGKNRAARILARLEDLTRYRIFTKTRVLLCTVDSTERMLNDMERGTQDAAERIFGLAATDAPSPLVVDTAILDEAACVLETAVPIILALGINNLTLVGDQHQLQPFSRVTDDQGSSNHSRSLMERALQAGARSQFLDEQYRMHTSICTMISENFYEGTLNTAPETKSARRSSSPLKWVHVSGGETKHSGRGYSNDREVPEVLKQAWLAVEKYGHGAEVRVITFYNMQKRALEREFERHPGLSHVRVTSVDACQGSDADVIIISTVRSGGLGYQLSGFMLDRRRVNVALSRAREECVVVGDKHTLRDGGGAMWRSVVNHFSS